MRQILAALYLLLLVGTGAAAQAPSVSPREFLAATKSQERVFVLDVRTNRELQNEFGEPYGLLCVRCRTAHHPYVFTTPEDQSRADAAFRVQAFALMRAASWRGERVFVFCQEGVRAMQAARVLGRPFIAVEGGYTNPDLPDSLIKGQRPLPSPKSAALR